MRVLWYSNAPWAPSGYGQQTAQVLPHFADRYGSGNVAVAANYGLHGAVQKWNGVRVYPGGLDVFSDDVVPVHALHWFNGKPGLLFTLYDVYVLRNPAWAEFPVVAWVPVDHAPCPPAVVEWFQRTDAVPVAMSRYGQRKLVDAGLEALYVPHAIDLDVFRPREPDRALFGIPDGAYVVGMVANNKGKNPARKGFGEAFCAFSKFADRNPEAVLYVHAEQHGTNDGVDLEALAAACRISDKVIFSDQYEQRIGSPPDQMAKLYSTFDVLLSPSYGEGFGIPVIEAQACGTPAIVTDFSAQPELVPSRQWTVGGQRWWDERMKAWFYIPQVDGIVDRLEMAYGRGPLRVEADRDYAIDHAALYESGRVWSEFWVPALEKIEGRFPDAAPIAV